jgi:hypothetical protein
MATIQTPAFLCLKMQLGMRPSTSALIGKERRFGSISGWFTGRRGLRRTRRRLRRENGVGQFARILAAINGVIFHTLPTLVFRRFSPGLITACVFVCPVVVTAYVSASREGLISVHSLVISTVIGTISMFTPVVFARLNRQRMITKRANQAPPPSL